MNISLAILGKIILVILLLIPFNGWAADCNQTAKTQVEIDLCARKNVNKADGDLNTIYQTLADKISPENRKKLEEAKKAWQDFRKKQCEFNSSGVLDGSAHNMVMSDCYISLTIDYSKLLLSQINCEEGNLSCVR